MTQVENAGAGTWHMEYSTGMPWTITLFYHPWAAIFSHITTLLLYPVLRWGNWGSEMLNNICSSWGPPQIHRAPEPWLRGTEFYDPRNLSGFAALEKSSIEWSALEELPPSSLLQSLSPFHLWLSLGPSPPDLHPQPIIIKLLSPLSPGKRDSVRKLIIYLPHCNFSRSNIALKSATSAENTSRRLKHGGSEWAMR